MNLERTQILTPQQCQCFLSCNLLFFLSPLLYISLGSNCFPSFKGHFKYSASTPILHYNLRNFMSNILLHAHLFWNFLSSFHLVVSIFSFILRYHLYRVNEKNVSCTTERIFTHAYSWQQPLRSRQNISITSVSSLMVFSVNDYYQPPKVICSGFSHHRLIFMSLNF